MRSIVFAAVLALLGSAAHAQPIAVDVATISMSAPGVPRVVTNTLCATDGNDLVCDRGAQLLPNGVISTTGLVVNGISITGSGGSASPTNVPAFSVHRNTVNQSVSTNVWTKIQFTTKVFDTFNNFDNSTNYRFQPTVPGRYLITLNVGCDAAVTWCFGSIRKNGGTVLNHFAGGNYQGSAGSVIADLNGSSDYIEGWAYANNGTSVAGSSALTNMTGSLLASGNGLISGSTALGDRITSGTASGVVAMAGGTVSFTTGGTSGTAYLDTLGRFVGAGVSTTGAISATSIYAGASLQLASPTAVTTCNSTAAGTIRYNSPTTTLELCTGSGWQPMGVGIPAGTISAFASTTCPVGWSEYTAARGRFLRGIDNGAGNDPSGTRNPGATQADAMQGHWHGRGAATQWQFGGAGVATAAAGGDDPTSVAPIKEAISDGVNGAPRTSTETRPKNVAVTFCQFNGTSNGWNNPLSGGSTVAAGSTGQLQYNTGNSFDASAGLTWTNASSLLGVAGTVSTTSITVGGLTLQQIMASATTAQADRITSGTSAVVVNSATGIVSISQLGAVASYVHPSVGYVGPGVSATGTVSGSRVATNDVKLSGVGGSCSVAEDYGRMFRNPTTGRLQLCMPRN